MGEGPEISLLAGMLIALFEHRTLYPYSLSNAHAEDFGLSADIISGGLGPASLVSDNAMFSSSTEAPLPLHPMGLGLSDSPSMAAYITTGSPGADTNNSQLVWKQSANLPDPDLLKHLYEVVFFPHRSTWIYIVIAGLTSSLLVIPMQTGFCTDQHSFCEQPFFLRDSWLTNVTNSTLSLPQTHPKYPRAALLHAICAVASAFTPAVSNPNLHGTRGNKKHWLPSCASHFLTSLQMRFLSRSEEGPQLSQKSKRNLPPSRSIY